MRVDFLNHQVDLQVLVLGRLGFSTAFIAQKCNLSIPQVQYRLGKGRVARREYRDGKSTEVGLVMGALMPSITRKLKDELKDGH